MDTNRCCPHTILLRTLRNPDAKQQAGIVPFPIHPALCRNVPHSSSQDMTTINGMNTMKSFHNNDARSLMVLHHQKMLLSTGRLLIDPRERRSLMIRWGSGSNPARNEPLIYSRTASRGLVSKTIKDQISIERGIFDLCGTRAVTDAETSDQAQSDGGRTGANPEADQPTPPGRSLKWGPVRDYLLRPTPSLFPIDGPDRVADAVEDFFINDVPPAPQAASARLLMTEAVRSEHFPAGSTRDISWQEPWKRHLLDTYGQSESQMIMTDGSRVRIVHEPAPVTRSGIGCAWITASPREVPLEETVWEGPDTDSVQLEACERALVARAECSARNPRLLRILLRRCGKAISCAPHRDQGAPAVKLPPRRLPQAQREVVDHLIREMLHAGVIELPSGLWSSPVVLVRKKDLSPRFCVHYRRLKAVTRVDAQPIPRIDDTLNALAGAKWFSTLYLASGYWQVEVAGRDREKTAFSTPLGLFQFRVMPFGLCNAPATFIFRLENFDDIMPVGNSVETDRRWLNFGTGMFSDIIMRECRQEDETESSRKTKRRATADELARTRRQISRPHPADRYIRLIRVLRLR
ncbi:Transposon Ty3-G Gag-Pol polyprotein [Trichinella patagoniensis]|uniref:Transposon Ty3-G Gag-Pol polyprotein n=1 Tax=Trichinella patagoniensis TaxID=990121 RepID=A0A0V1AD69_9BILA|nr:Transposon Ty3-G Gag-Pol polyprotein [Trichinella patagoniensis]